MGKSCKPRRKEGVFLFDLVVRDGNTRILEFREKRLSALDEVLEMLRRKL